MQLYLPYVWKAKTGAHVVQGLFIFIAWAITIAVLVNKGPTDGRTKFYFALCWMSIPALIYLIMVPMWSKAKRFANAYAYAALDVSFSILWFAAFIAVATWNAAGAKAGAKKKKLDGDAGNCTTFDYGSPQRCNLSKATVGLGVCVFLLFVITSVISVYGAIYFRKHGHLLGGAPRDDPGSVEAQTKDAFEPNDANDLEGSNMEQVSYHEEDEHALLHHTQSVDGHHLERSATWSRDDPGQLSPEDYRESFMGEYELEPPSREPSVVSHDYGVSPAESSSYLPRRTSDSHPGYPI
ncbi:MAG: hypothetical protein M4579_000283 [Chaenotheca gracillima]|nr:MAG: hypothetical protein M4579_000283 [Chaenotheca gracillima]